VRGVTQDDVELQSIIDRVEAVGGSLLVDDTDVLTLRVPVAADEPVHTG
jgi:hypothetical protein